MKKFYVVPLLISLLVFQLWPRMDVQVATQDSDVQASRAQFALLPLVFEPNQGQAADDISYLVHHDAATTYFHGISAITVAGRSRVSMNLDGANQASFVAVEPMASKTNYFIGNDPTAWQTDIPNYKQLFAKDVYSGIDLRYYGTNEQLEHDFIVNPGADYQQIAMLFEGQDSLSLDPSGNLVLKAGDVDLLLHAPVTYQDTELGKKNISSKFVIEGSSVKIAVNDEFDLQRPLVIDPVLTLNYSTYIGGGAVENAHTIRVDNGGNAYVAGFTSSTDFPTASPYQGSFGGGSGDAFISKLDPTGSSLLFSTYLGGSAIDLARNIAFDSSGDAYIVGQTASADFPVVSPYQGSFAGGSADGFIAKLTSSGSLAYATFVGGSGEDVVYGAAMSGINDIYFSGFTDSTDFPVTGGAFQTANAGGQEAFASKLDVAGSTLLYSTYLGGTDSDVAIAMTIDTADNAYILGASTSGDFPTASPYQAANANPGSADNFVTKLDPTGSSLIYSTYLGGTGTDYPTSNEIALDGSDNVFVSGFTDSTDFPVTGGSYQGVNAGGIDAYVTKLDATGSGLIYSTYLGGSGNDFSEGLALNSSYEVYITGQTDSSDFPVNSAFQVSNGGGVDAFVARFNDTGSGILFSTYLGGAGNDFSHGVALDSIYDIYLAGQTTSTNFPTHLPYQASNAGSSEAFVAKITSATVTLQGQVAPTLTFTLGATTCNLGIFSATQTKFCTHTMGATTNAANGYVIAYLPTTTLTSGGNTIDAMAVQGASVLSSEQFGFNLRANTAAGSFTATDFGTDPVGGSGFAVADYNTVDQFKFDTGGDDIAQAISASDTTTFTASFMANTEIITEAGLYEAPIIYNVVASY